MKQVRAIARATLVEAIQQPVAFLIMLSAVMTTLLVPVFQFHRFGEDGRLAPFKSLGRAQRRCR